MKALAILFRLVFSIIVLIAVACYLQVSPTTTLSEFCNSISSSALLDQLCGINYLTVSLALVILLTIFSITRILDAIWNTLFCASILVLIASGLYTLAGPGIALPSALVHNEAVNQFCQSFTAYEIPLAITLLIFIAGWVCASACGRVAITAVISYALWYGVTEFFTYASQLWANNASPALPEALYIVQGTPWILAAVPGAFFLIYALLMACFETYIGNGKKKAAKKKAEPAPADNKEVKDTESAPKAEKEQKPAEPVSKTKPVLKLATATASPTNKLKPATPVAEKPATVAEAKKEKPAEGPKKEEKPAEEPTKEEKPAEEPKKVEKPAEEPKKEEKPAEEPTKEEKPAEEPTKEEKPAEEKKPEEKAPEAPAEAEKPVEEPAQAEITASEGGKTAEKSAEASDSEQAKPTETKTEEKAEEAKPSDSAKE